MLSSATERRKEITRSRLEGECLTLSWLSLYKYDLDDLDDDDDDFQERTDKVKAPGGSLTKLRLSMIVVDNFQGGIILSWSSWHDDVYDHQEKKLMKADIKWKYQKIFVQLFHLKFPRQSFIGF